jgi:hypothetical protein
VEYSGAAKYFSNIMWNNFNKALKNILVVEPLNIAVSLLFRETIKFIIESAQKE